MPQQHGASATILAKLECFPAASVKDRIGAAMSGDREEAGVARNTVLPDRTDFRKYRDCHGVRSGLARLPAEACARIDVDRAAQNAGVPGAEIIRRRRLGA
jgi:hypothetical protein